MKNIPKCKNCGKELHVHRASDSACPIGKKDRTGGYPFPYGQPEFVYQPVIKRVKK